MSKRLLFLGLLFFVSPSLNAKIVSFACPLSQSIQFIPIHHSKEFIAFANIRIIQGNTPIFKMQGVASNNQVGNFIKAYFFRDRLLCLYQYKTIENSTQLTLENQATPGLEYCFFPSTKSSDCQGDTDYCYLSCEILSIDQVGGKLSFEGKKI